MVGIIAAPLEVIHEIKKGKSPAELQRLMEEKCCQITADKHFPSFSSTKRERKPVIPAADLRERAGIWLVFWTIPFQKEGSTFLLH